MRIEQACYFITLNARLPGAPFLASFVRKPALSEAEGWGFRWCGSKQDFFQLLQFRVFRLGSLQDGDVGVGILAMALVGHSLVNGM
jgi:hypothetical protein